MWYMNKPMCDYCGTQSWDVRYFPSKGRDMYLHPECIEDQLKANDERMIEIAVLDELIEETKGELDTELDRINATH